MLRTVIPAITLSLLILPTSAQVIPDHVRGFSAENAVSSGVVLDERGNSYGVVQNGAYEDPNTGSHDPLKNLIRFANITIPLSPGQHLLRGKTISLKARAPGGKCKQSLRGTNQSNLLDGSMSSCDETFYGEDGDDVMLGGSGNNLLDGGKGADIITGGTGANIFVYERVGDSTPDESDLITDFKSNDTLDLSGVSATSGVRLNFIGWHPFTGVPGQVNYKISEYWKCDPYGHCSDIYVTVVEADLTGSGYGDFSIDLVGRHFLHSRNFVLDTG